MHVLNVDVRLCMISNKNMKKSEVQNLGLIFYNLPDNFVQKHYTKKGADLLAKKIAWCHADLHTAFFQTVTKIKIPSLTATFESQWFASIRLFRSFTGARWSSHKQTKHKKQYSGYVQPICVMLLAGFGPPQKIFPCCGRRSKFRASDFK